MPHNQALNRLAQLQRFAVSAGRMHEAELLQAAVECAASLLSADACAYFASLTGTGTLRARAAVGWPQARTEQLVLPEGAGSFADHVLNRGSVLICNADDPSRFKLPRALYALGSGLAVAVRDGSNRGVGMLLAQTRQSDAFNDADLSWFELLAQMLGLMLARPLAGRVDPSAEDIDLFWSADAELAEKMEAIGRLASGIAHDFNNLLTIVASYTELLTETIGPGHPLEEQVTEIKHAAARATALTEQLLNLSRSGPSTSAVIDVGQVIRKAEPVLTNLLGPEVELETKAAGEPLLIKADPAQLDYLLLALALNARDAMPAGGRLKICTALVPLHNSAARETCNYVKLTVSDTGVGMDESTRRRLFEPFFTTKSPGPGVGLGLARVYAFVRQSSGHIQVSSEIGQGSSFDVYFPVCSPTARPLTKTHLRLVGGGGQTVLLAEDDDAVRRLIRRVLLMKSYTLLDAASGDQALALCEQHSGRIDLLLTDVVMPGLGGRELAAQVIQRHPDCKVLYISGFTDDAVLRNGVLDTNMAFLQKPFTPELLARKVREMLQSATRSAKTG